MNTDYIRVLGELIRECNKEIDRAQVNEPPAETLLDRIETVLHHRKAMLQ